MVHCASGAGLEDCPRSFRQDTFTGMSLLLILPFVYGLLLLTGHVLILGLPLPFLSYGGSHLLAEFGALGFTAKYLPQERYIASR